MSVFLKRKIYIFLSLTHKYKKLISQALNFCFDLQFRTYWYWINEHVVKDKRRGLALWIWHGLIPARRGVWMLYGWCFRLSGLAYSPEQRRWEQQSIKMSSTQEQWPGSPSALYNNPSLFSSLKVCTFTLFIYTLIVLTLTSASYFLTHSLCC